MFGDKLSTANARIATLAALVAATGFKIEADAALPTPEAFTAYLESQRSAAIEAATASAVAAVQTSSATLNAFSAGLTAAGVKFSDTVRAEDVAVPEGRAAADTPFAQTIKSAVDTAIAAKSAKQISAAGHPHAIEVAVGGRAADADAGATPTTAEEFLAAHAAIKDPVKKTEFFRKHSARFPVR